MSSDYISGTTISDHDITLAIPGDVGTVRARLVNAIQTLGYKVLGEQPVYAKRGPRGAATWDCSLNVLDYATTVTISLKQTNDAAVLATFNFEIKSYMRMTKGDRRTLAREAEAIAALAMTIIPATAMAAPAMARGTGIGFGATGSVGVTSRSSRPASRRPESRPSSTSSRPASSARAISPSTSASPLARAGLWSVMPATRKTRSRRRACPMRSSMPSIGR